MQKDDKNVPSALNRWSQLSAFSIVVGIICILNFICSKMGAPFWAVRFVYVWIFYVYATGLSIIMVFQPEEVLVTERVKGVLPRFVVSSIVRVGMLFLWFFAIGEIMIPLSLDTFYMLRGGRLIERELKVKSITSSSYHIISRSISFENEAKTYNQAFAFSRQPKEGDVLRIYFLKRSRFILETEFVE